MTDQKYRYLPLLFERVDNQRTRVMIETGYRKPL